MKNTDMIINPSDVIKNKMKEIGITQHRLAYLVETQVETLNKKIQRTRGMDVEFIYKLSRILGIGDNSLAKYEYYYRQFEEKDEDFMEEYNNIKDVYDILCSKRIIKKEDNIIAVVKEFRKFMEVSSYSKIRREFHTTKAFTLIDKDRLTFFAWIQIGLKKMRTIKISQKYDFKEYKEQYIDEISNITEKDFYKKIIKTSGKYGVILNFEESLKDLPIRAYSKKLPSGKLFVQMVCNLSNDDIIKTLEKMVNETSDENEKYYRVIYRTKRKYVKKNKSNN